MHRRRRLPLILVAWLALLVQTAPSTVHAAPPAQAERCFPETTQCISGRFRTYWEEHGALAVFGYPLGPAEQQENADTGQTYLTQWFERARFEWHPENRPPYDVLLGRLGNDRLLEGAVVWQKQSREAGPQRGCLWFVETGFNVCDQAPGAGFKSYWQTHGLIDRQLNPYARSLALFGFPLSSAFITTNEQGDRVLTQWFERARFEWHPGKPRAFRVLLGLLGAELARPQPVSLHGSIVYSRSTDGRRAIELFNLTGTKVRITTPGSDELAPAWSPDRQFLAYMRSDGAYFTLHRARLDGSGQQQLTTQLYPDEDCTVSVRPLGFSATAPAWSPDGRHIVFAGGDNQQNDTCIYLMQADGSTITNLTPRQGSNRFSQPTWAPDGHHIAASSRDGIYVMRHDGTARRRLISTGGLDWSPAWSPDGRHIAFVSDISDVWEAFVVNADGSGLTRLTHSPSSVRQLAWSPDGRYLLLVQDTTNGNEQLAVMPFEATGGPVLRRRIGEELITAEISTQPWRER